MNYEAINNKISEITGIPIDKIPFRIDSYNDTYKWYVIHKSHGTYYAVGTPRARTDAKRYKIVLDDLGFVEKKKATEIIPVHADKQETEIDLLSKDFVNKQNTLLKSIENLFIDLKKAYKFTFECFELDKQKAIEIIRKTYADNVTAIEESQEHNELQTTIADIEQTIKNTTFLYNEYNDPKYASELRKLNASLKLKRESLANLQREKAVAIHKEQQRKNEYLIRLESDSIELFREFDLKTYYKSEEKRNTQQGIFNSSIKNEIESLKKLNYNTSLIEKFIELLKTDRNIITDNFTIEQIESIIEKITNDKKQREKQRAISKAKALINLL